MGRAIPLVAVLAAAMVIAIGMSIMATMEPAEASFPGKNGKIAFVRHSQLGKPAAIYTMKADGSEQTRLTKPPLFGIWYFAGDRSPAWSPDGTKIAFARYQNGDSEIYTMNADGSEQTRLTNNLASDFLPTWSPDGAKIAFGRDRDNDADGEAGIYTMNADGSDVTRLTHNPTVSGYDGAPSWSPDGSKIAFHRFADGEGWAIYTMNADGSAQTNITNLQGVPEFSPDWSPDSSKIAFYSARGRLYDIYTMKPDGSDVTPLTDGTVHSSEPSWSPDGTKIVFDRVENGGRGLGIHTMNADGSNVTPISNHPVGLINDTEPAWQPLPTPPSPERCTITGTAGRDVLRGTAGRDVVCAKGGDDTIEGRGGNDVLRGGPGVDAIEGGSGADRLHGERGMDALTAVDGVRGNDAMEGGGGWDACWGDRGDAKRGCP